MLDEFATVLGGLTFHPARIPVVSNLTGAVAEPGLMQQPSYWLRQVREAVRFADGVVATGSVPVLGVGSGRCAVKLERRIVAGGNRCRTPAPERPRRKTTTTLTAA